tara:strand:+ start:22536 stop:24569 length:2034 start_codon:yes stop_codon:yes gene_type:complete
MPEVVFSYSPYWIIAIVLLAAGLSYGYYLRTNTFEKTQRWLLASLRFLVLVLLGFLFLQPHFNSESFREEKPILVFLEDQSASILAVEDSISHQKRQAEMVNMRSSLDDKFTVRTFNFGANLSDTSVDAQETNLGAALKELSGRFYKENIAALVLSSDGIVNRGSRLSTLSENNLAPIYTIALGDSSSRLDLAVSKILYNKSLLKGRSQNVSVNFKAENYAGNDLSIKLLNSKNEVLHERSFKVNSDNWFEKVVFKIEGEKVGLQLYRIAIAPLSEEENTTNNQKSFSIEVLDAKERIGIFARNTHPDIAALTRALSKDENYEIKLLQDDNANLDSLDLIIALQSSKALFNRIYNSTKALWLIASPNDDFSDWNFWPEIKSFRVEAEESYVEINPNFSLFPIYQSETNLWAKLPPLDGFYGRIEAPKGFSTLFFKNIANISTSTPALTLGEEKGRRMAISLGLGYWRWRIYAYKQMGDFESFDGIIQKIAKYLLSQAKNEGLKIEVPRENLANTPINWRASFFDASGNLVNDAELKLQLQAENGSEYNYVFQKRLKDYALNTKGLTEGKYHYRANLGREDKEYQQEGDLIIQLNRLELQNLKADPALLRNISQSSAGKFYQQNEITILAEDLSNLEAATLSYPVLNTSSIFSTWQLFFVALGLLGLEWLLRKLWGKI